MEFCSVPPDDCRRSCLCTPFVFLLLNSVGLGGKVRAIFLGRGRFLPWATCAAHKHKHFPTMLRPQCGLRKLGGTCLFSMSVFVAVFSARKVFLNAQVLKIRLGRSGWNTVWSMWWRLDLNWQSKIRWSETGKRCAEPRTHFGACIHVRPLRCSLPGQCQAYRVLVLCRQTASSARAKTLSRSWLTWDVLSISLTAEPIRSVLVDQAKQRSLLLRGAKRHVRRVITKTMVLPRRKLKYLTKYG